MIRTIWFVLLVFAAWDVSKGSGKTYVGDFVLGFAVENIVEDIDGGAGFEGNTGSEALVVDVLDEFLGTSLFVGGSGGFVGSGGVDGGFIVEAVEITTSLLELLDPFLGLLAMVNMLFSRR